MHDLRRHFTVQTAGHIVMLAFAAASLANVESFFAHLHPGLPLLSWGLGVALGSGLLVMAGLLSGMAWDWSDARFQVVASTAAALALLSGGIQAAAYAAHMTSTIAAGIVGLSLPVVGELGVALAVSAYTQAQRRQRMADAQTQLADGVRMHIGEAVATLDPAKIQAQVDRAAALVTRAIVDSTVADMLAELKQSAPGFSADPAENSGVGGLPLDADPANGENADPAPPSDADERRVKLLEILRSDYAGQPADGLNKTALGKTLGTSARTITRDLSALEDQGLLALNGHVVVL